MMVHDVKCGGARDAMIAILDPQSIDQDEFSQSRCVSLPLVSTRTISVLNGFPSSVSISQLITSGRAPRAADRMSFAFEEIEQFWRWYLAH